MVRPCMHICCRGKAMTESLPSNDSGMRIRTHTEQWKVLWGRLRLWDLLKLITQHPGYVWATVFLRDINTGTWPSRLGGDSRIGTIKYGLQSRGTQTRAGLRWRGSAATVNYRPVLSSERALQNNKPTTVERKFQRQRKIGHGSHMCAWHQDGLADWCSNVTLTLIGSSDIMHVPHFIKTESVFRN
jgi:hypothetical protein